MLVAHGSRRKESNDEVVVLTRKLGGLCAEKFSVVHYGFLELADTLIPTGISRCIEDGATAITVLPYFLNSGRHVVEDIPNVINECRALYPDIAITIAPHVGASQGIFDVLIASASSQT